VVLSHTLQGHYIFRNGTSRMEQPERMKHWLAEFRKLLRKCRIRNIDFYSVGQLKVDVAWNNLFKKIFNACWRESVKVKRLLFYCCTSSQSLCCSTCIVLYLQRIAGLGNTFQVWLSWYSGLSIANTVCGLGRCLHSLHLPYCYHGKTKRQLCQCIVVTVGSSRSL